MAFCKQCGAELGEENKFCGNCGAQIEKAESASETSAEENTEKIENVENNDTYESADQGSYEDTCKTEPISEEVFNIPEQNGKLSVGMLIWSIINTVFSFCVCCLPVGILPLVFAIMTKKEDYEKSQKNRKLALIFNIVVTSLMVISFVICAVYMILFGDVILEAVEAGMYN